MKRSLFLAGAALLITGVPAIAQQTAADPAASATPAPQVSTDTSAAPDAAAPEASTTVSDAAPSTADATTATAPATENAATTPSPSTDTAAAPVDATTQSASAAPAADPAKSAAADQLIERDWAKYDPQSKGELTALEFGNWVMAAQGQDLTAQTEKSRNSKAAGLPATKVLNATAAEFSRADADHNRTISREELKTYLAG